MTHNLREFSQVQAYIGSDIVDYALQQESHATEVSTSVILHLKIPSEVN